jgi:monoamine oxidase
VRWLAEVERTQPAEASEIRAVEGAGLLVDLLRKPLEGRCDVRLRALVRTVRWQQRSVEIETSDGARLDADAAVVTVPLPLLDPPGDEPAALRFIPGLEEKRAASRRLHMGPVVKVVLAFDRPFWHDIEGLQEVLFVHAYERPVPTWWMPAEATASTLTGWAGGPFATRLAGVSADALPDLAVHSAADALGSPPQDVRARLRACHFHDWSADPFARGAYTYVGVGGADAYRTMAAPVGEALYFAGEATCGGGYNATMEGAIRSGRRAAEELLRR